MYAITHNEALSLTRSIKEKLTSNEALIIASLPVNFTAQINYSDISPPIPIVQPKPVPVPDTIATTSTVSTTYTTTFLTNIPDTTSTNGLTSSYGN